MLSCVHAHSVEFLYNILRIIMSCYVFAADLSDCWSQDQEYSVCISTCKHPKYASRFMSEVSDKCNLPKSLLNCPLFDFPEQAHYCCKCGALHVQSLSSFPRTFKIF